MLKRFFHLFANLIIKKLQWNRLLEEDKRKRSWSGLSEACWLQNCSVALFK